MRTFHLSSFKILKNYIFIAALRIFYRKLNEFYEFWSEFRCSYLMPIDIEKRGEIGYSGYVCCHH